MAHIFIVNENTIPFHLKYKFAGTGAKEYKGEFLRNNDIELEGKRTERILSEMIADISRVKEGDDVIFYLQHTNTHEGMFFGSFKVAEEPFLCNDNFLYKEGLHKNLIFRVQLIPDKVYSKGITERECLDSLDGITHPSQMCWSLIYRKLNGNRGCTMITNYEYDQIMKKLAEKNSNEYINTDNFDYDATNTRIIASDKEYQYTGKRESLDIKDRFLYKRKEAHLQAYILQNLFDIDCLKANSDKITWIGNEVYCGVGMQSMDICFIQENEKETNISICELKTGQPKEYIKYQLQKYIEWIKDYIVPTYNKKVIIDPIIVAQKPLNRTKEMHKSIRNYLTCTSEQFAINPIKYIKFEIKDNNIFFDEVKVNE